MESSYTKLKLGNEAKIQKANRDQQRQVSLLVLIQKFLCENGYVQTMQALQNETGQLMVKYEVADNIDLLSIIREFEDYYTLKFGKLPKLIRKTGTSPNASSPCHSSRSGGPNSSTYSSKPTSRLKPLIHSYRSLDEPSHRDPSVKQVPALTQSDSAIEVVPIPSLKELSVSGSGLGLKYGNDQDVPRPSDQVTDPSDQDPTYHLNKPIPYPINTEYHDLAVYITRDIIQEPVPKVTFDHIAGAQDAKQLIHEALIFPVQFPELFGPSTLITPWKGILMHGPPGTGKTLLAKGIACECSSTFFHISASSIVSKWRGDSEKLVRVLFELAKYHAPSTIFMDEVESLMGRRGIEGEHEGTRRMKTEILVQMDGIQARNQEDGCHVFFLAATNMPWELDEALLRRMDKRILIDLPDQASRRAILEQQLPQNVTDAKNQILIEPKLDYDLISNATDGYSGSDLHLIAKESLMGPIRKLISQQQKEMGRGVVLSREMVSTEHVLNVIQRTKKSVGEKSRLMHKQWADQYKCL